MRIRHVPLPQPHNIVPLRTSFSREIRNSEPARLSVFFWAVARADCVLDEAGAVRRLLDLRVCAEAPDQRHSCKLRWLTRREGALCDGSCAAAHGGDEEGHVLRFKGIIGN